MPIYLMLTTLTPQGVQTLFAFFFAQSPGVTGIDLTVRKGGKIVAPPEGERYLGFVYARGQGPGEVETALRKALSTLEVQLEG